MLVSPLQQSGQNETQPSCLGNAPSNAKTYVHVHSCKPALERPASEPFLYHSPFGRDVQFQRQRCERLARQIQTTGSILLIPDAQHCDSRRSKRDQRAIPGNEKVILPAISSFGPHPQVSIASDGCPGIQAKRQ